MEMGEVEILKGETVRLKMRPEDLELIDVRRFQIEEIAKVFAISPEAIPGIGLLTETKGPHAT